MTEVIKSVVSETDDLEYRDISRLKALLLNPDSIFNAENNFLDI